MDSFLAEKVSHDDVPPGHNKHPSIQKLPSRLLRHQGSSTCRSLTKYSYPTEVYTSEHHALESSSWSSSKLAGRNLVTSWYCLHGEGRRRETSHNNTMCLSKTSQGVDPTKRYATRWFARVSVAHAVSFIGSIFKMPWVEVVFGCCLKRYCCRGVICSFARSRLGSRGRVAGFGVLGGWVGRIYNGRGARVTHEEVTLNLNMQF